MAQNGVSDLRQHATTLLFTHVMSFCEDIPQEKRKGSLQKQTNKESGDACSLGRSRHVVSAPFQCKERSTLIDKSNAGSSLWVPLDGDKVGCPALHWVIVDRFLMTGLWAIASERIHPFFFAICRGKSFVLLRIAAIQAIHCACDLTTVGVYPKGCTHVCDSGNGRPFGGIIDDAS